MSRQSIFSSNEATINPLDLHKEFKAKNIALNAGKIVVASTMNEGMQSGDVLDITMWLKQASVHYKISDNIHDYVMVPVPIIPSDFPNRNGIGFPLETLMEFIPDQGCLSYQTWKGKPVQFEHKNDDITQAKGVIADAALRKMEGFGGKRGYKAVHLYCLDRTKDPDLVKAVLRKEYNSYSMGAYLKRRYCSYCGADVGKCIHIDAKAQATFYEFNGHVVHVCVTGVVGFESSVVGQPAWSLACSDILLGAPDR